MIKLIMGFCRKQYMCNYHERNRERARELSRAAVRRFRATAKGRDYCLNWSLEKKFGITLEQRNALLEAQGGICKGCGSITPQRKGDWLVDHDHKTKRVRGILCHNCNVTLGLMKDDPSKLRRLAKYLEESNMEV